MKIKPINGTLPKTGHPGSAIQCRCVAIAFLDEETLSHLELRPFFNGRLLADPARAYFGSAQDSKGQAAGHIAEAAQAPAGCQYQT